MALTPAEIRQRIAARITSALGSVARPWRESGFHYLNFPPKDPSTVLPRSFAVGVRSVQMERARDRQRREVGALATTEVRVRWSSTVRADGQVDDVDQGMDDGDLLVATVLGTSPTPELEIRFLGFAPYLSYADGTLLVGEVAFQVRHRYPLQ